MRTIQEPITGHEAAIDSREPLAALSQFYRALNTRDLALMEQNWDPTEEAAMDNPLGGINRGWAEIRPVYESLFASPGRYRFEFYDYTLLCHAEVFIAIGREQGQLLIAERQVLDLAIRTTRIFRWAGKQWRQLHHHGSIDDPDMLARYRPAVLKRAA